MDDRTTHYVAPVSVTVVQDRNKVCKPEQWKKAHDPRVVFVFSRLVSALIVADALEEEGKDEAARALRLFAVANAALFSGSASVTAPSVSVSLPEFVVVHLPTFSGAQVCLILFLFL